MRWTSLIVAGMLSCLILSTRAKADPITLSLHGRVPGGIYIDNYWMDVTNGFEGLTITEDGWAPIPAPGHFDLPFTLGGGIRLDDRRPYDWIEFEISGTLSGDVFRNFLGILQVTGTMHGSGSISEISIPLSVDPAEVPSWLPGLTVTISGFSPIKQMDVTEMTATFSSHPVPEPTPFAVLGAGLFALAVRRYRRRGSRAAI